MNVETALTILIGRSKLAPFTATGHGHANQRVQGVIAGHMVEVNRRGEQVRVEITRLDGYTSGLLNRDTAYDVLSGDVTIESAGVELFH